MLTTIAITAAIALALGIGGTFAVQAALAPDEVAPAVAATATVVEAAVEEDVTAADTRQAVATMPAVNIAVEAAVRPSAAPSTVALAAYLGCLAASQEQAQGAAAYGCNDRGKTLDAAIGGEP